MDDPAPASADGRAIPARWHYDDGLGHFRWVKEAGPIAERIAQMS